MTPMYEYGCDDCGRCLSEIRGTFDDADTELPVCQGCGKPMQRVEIPRTARPQGGDTPTYHHRGEN